MDKEFIKKNWLPILFVALFIGVMIYLINKKIAENRENSRMRMARKADLEKAAIQSMTTNNKSDEKTTSSYYPTEMGYAGENKEMVLNYNQAIKHHTEELARVAGAYTKEVPSWVVAKLNRSATDISDITHYLEGESGIKGTLVRESKFGPGPQGGMSDCEKNCLRQFNNKMQDCGRFLATNNKAAYTNCIAQAQVDKQYCMQNCNPGGSNTRVGIR